MHLKNDLLVNQKKKKIRQKSFYKCFDWNKSENLFSDTKIKQLTRFTKSAW